MKQYHYSLCAVRYVDGQLGEVSTQQPFYTRHQNRIPLPRRSRHRIVRNVFWISAVSLRFVSIASVAIYMDRSENSGNAILLLCISKSTA